MVSIANIDQQKVIFPVVAIMVGLREKQIQHLHHAHKTHSLKVNNPKKDKNQLQVL